jgi:chromosome segregation ATPase
MSGVHAVSCAVAGIVLATVAMMSDPAAAASAGSTMPSGRPQAGVDFERRALSDMGRMTGGNTAARSLMKVDVAEYERNIERRKAEMAPIDASIADCRRRFDEARDRQNQLSRQRVARNSPEYQAVADELARSRDEIAGLQREMSDLQKQRTALERAPLTK